MSRVQLIHWNLNGAKERAGWLEAAGYEVAYQVPDGPGFLRRLREEPPAAVVIDLGRLPSQGRDVALSIRKQGATRHVPLLFVGGEAAKVARLKELLPDAVYTSWAQIGGSLAQAIAQPPQEPAVPASVFAAYAGRPLAQKLGIKAESEGQGVGKNQPPVTNYQLPVASSQ